MPVALWDRGFLPQEESHEYRMTIAPAVEFAVGLAFVLAAVLIGLYSGVAAAALHLAVTIPAISYVLDLGADNESAFRTRTEADRQDL